MPFHRESTFQGDWYMALLPKHACSLLFLQVLRLQSLGRKSETSPEGWNFEKKKNFEKNERKSPERILTMLGRWVCHHHISGVNYPIPETRVTTKFEEKLGICE